MKLLQAKIMVLAAAVMVNSACQSDVRPAIVPGVEVKNPEVEASKNVTQKHSLGVIGEIEPIYFLPMKKPFLARIDTGAETSSIDVANRTIFERDGEQCVRTIIVQRHIQRYGLATFQTSGLGKINQSGICFVMDSLICSNIC